MVKRQEEEESRVKRTKKAIKEKTHQKILMKREIKKDRVKLEKFRKKRNIVHL